MPCIHASLIIHNMYGHVVFVFVLVFIHNEFVCICLNVYHICISLYFYSFCVCSYVYLLYRRERVGEARAGHGAINVQHIWISLCLYLYLCLCLHVFPSVAEQGAWG